jgi:large conductance mechanosensitive channel
MLKGWKDFLFRGNVIDLAVAVIIGAAFGAVVTALVKDLMTPLIAALVGQPDFGKLKFTINKGEFLYGDFLNAVISFLLVGSAVYFFVIVPVKAMAERTRRAEPPAAPTTQKCPECLSEIPIGARRCAHCTAVLAAGAGARY